MLGVGAVEPRHAVEEAASAKDSLAHTTALGATAPSADAGKVPARYSSGAGWADVFAPGGPVSAELEAEGSPASTIVGDPQPFVGTSFAAPVVSGAAALVRQVQPHLSAAEVMAILLDSALPGGQAEKIINPQGAVDLARSVSSPKATSAGQSHVDGDQPSPTIAPGTPNVLLPVSARPVASPMRDYSVPLVLAGVLSIVLIVALFARALSSESTPPSGNGASTRLGTRV